MKGDQQVISKIMEEGKPVVSVSSSFLYDHYALDLLPEETVGMLFTRIGIPLDLDIIIIINGVTTNYDTLLRSGKWVFIKPKIHDVFI